MTGLDYLSPFGKEFSLTLATLVFIIIYASALKYIISRTYARRRKQRDELHKTIYQGFLNNSLDSVEDLTNVYKGVYGLGADDFSYRAGLSRALRRYLVDIISGASLEQNELKRLKDKVSMLLKQIETESPFADLPAAERNLIVDTQKFLHAGDKDSAIKKLEDLAGLIEVRQDAFEKLQSSNKWSIPIAVMGLIFSLFFGIISVITYFNSPGSVQGKTSTIHQTR